MAYQNRDYSPSGMAKIPPGTAPKPFIPGNQPYRAGGMVYHRMNEADEPGRFPPPPPPGADVKFYNYGQEDDFPPPPPLPPPAPVQSYGDDDSHLYTNVYSGEAKFMRTEDYRPPDYRSASSKAYSANTPDSNYANIQINIAPPTPTSKDFDYSEGRIDQIAQRSGNTAEVFRVGGGQVSKSFERERPVPGPMVPTSYQAMSPGSGTAGKQPKMEKEAEVDALTDLLMKNMTSVTQDKDYWGMCGRCGNAVSGSVNACSALDNVYHIGCFTCVGCSVPLQGKSFFAMETKPYCESCYVNTLERCSVCSKPITDRLLRATGKPYHPDCFTCVVCGKSLDGIPFTVDATNQIHCIEDFHKKFAPRCCVCQRPIMPESGQDETVRIVAMDKSFHVNCYRCEDCGCLLSSEAEGRGCYPLDDHILCKNCNAKRIQALTTKMATEL